MLRTWTVLTSCMMFGCDQPAVNTLGQPVVARPEATRQEPEVSQVAAPAPPPRSWPHWLGPEYDGIAHEDGWSSKWPEDGLPEVWRGEIGIGFSSVAIADGRLFTMGWAEDKETVFCLESDSGKEIWKHTYPGAKIDNLHDGGPGATPTIEGDVVYTLGREGQLFCLKVASGEVVWEKKLPEETGVEVPEWGFTSSPLVEKDLVIVDGGRVVAFDKKTGEKRWQTKEYRPGYGTAVAFTRNDERLIAVLNNDCLLVVKAADGSEITQYPWETQFATTSTTPIIHEETIFISSGYGRGCALLKWNGDKLEEVYDNKSMANHFSNSVLYKDHLYGINGNTHVARLGTIVCMNYATSEVKWSQRGYGVGSLLISDGKCLVLSDSGELVCCEASPEGYQELAKAKILDGLCWTVPVLLNGRVYARNSAGDLVCVQLPRKE